MGDGVRFRVLGRLEVLRDDEPVTLGGATTVTVLAGLLLSPGCETSLDSLAELVWGQDPPVHPKAGLHNAVSRLRRLVGSEMIDTLPNGYRLQADAGNLDLLRFETLAADAADAAVRDVEAAVDIYDEALGLWRGPLLDNVDSDVVQREIVPRLRERYLAAQEKRIELYLRLGRHAQLVDELTTLVEAHPFRERLVGQLMLALYRGGRQAEALGVYERLRCALRDELGVDPGTALQDLHVKILRGDADLEPPAPEDHESTAPAPHQLPAGIGRLRGRETELAELDDWLDVRASAGAEDGEPLLATIVGPGGVGKTALAVRWAHDIADRFPDGQLYLNLRGYSSDATVTAAAALEMLLRALGVGAARIPASTDERAALLRSMLDDHRMLIVLDNARDSQQVRPLLPGSGCLTLVTSRSQLRGLCAREGAHRLTLGRLDTTTARDLLCDATDIAPAEFPEQPVAELVDLCAGLPLALRVVAERIGRDHYGLAEVITKLRDDEARLDALDTGDDEVTDVRAVLSWSYRALDHEAARAFRLLGLTAGPDIGLPAAAVLLDLPLQLARRVLDRLVSVHLLERGEGDRYGLHDLLHAYAAERARIEGEDTRAVRRLFHWYLETGLNAYERLYPASIVRKMELVPGEATPLAFDDVDDALRWFDAEHMCLVRAAEDAAERGMDDYAWRLVWSLDDFFLIYGATTLWREAAEVGLAAARRSGSREGELYMLNDMGKLYSELRRQEDSLEYFQQVLEIARADADRRPEAAALFNIGDVYLLLNDGHKALEYCERAMEIYTELGDDSHLIACYVNFGLAYNLTGQYQKAIECFEKGIASGKQLDIDRYSSVLIAGEAASYAGLGDHQTALERFGEALELNKAHDFRMLQGSNLLWMGDSFRAVGDVAQARVCWKQALEIFVELDTPDVDDVRARLSAPESALRG